MRPDPPPTPLEIPYPPRPPARASSGHTGSSLQTGTVLAAHRKFPELFGDRPPPHAPGRDERNSAEDTFPKRPPALPEATPLETSLLPDTKCAPTLSPIAPIAIPPRHASRWLITLLPARLRVALLCPEPVFPKLLNQPRSSTSFNKHCLKRRPACAQW